MSKKKADLTESGSAKKTFRERLGEQHEASMSQFQQFQNGKDGESAPVMRLLLLDVVLIFLVSLLILALMVFVQTVGVATLNVAFTSGDQQPPIADIIFTSAVVGGLCGAVLGWAPRIFTALRNLVRNRINSK